MTNDRVRSQAIWDNVKQQRPIIKAIERKRHLLCRSLQLSEEYPLTSCGILRSTDLFLSGFGGGTISETFKRSTFVHANEYSHNQPQRETELMKECFYSASDCR
ncbi:hypothetical protein AcW1_010311 [Taiwanofungus camphoratus]|nr:hypothetical protein AcW2_010333 [Antrodia cinnamomea]KAI0927891.1 hypothetical protein AcW2_010333 [Antrodia cinnamomea]KAI0956673.1 hypothetical protein AcW1_010311 [Antrodia cinnamomea]